MNTPSLYWVDGRVFHNESQANAFAQAVADECGFSIGVMVAPIGCKEPGRLGDLARMVAPRDAHCPHCGEPL
jgi:hypothetical protein